MKVIDKGPAKEVVKQIICKNCGATLEYVPKDITTLWSGTDMGGGPDGAEGFACPECHKDVITKRW